MAELASSTESIVQDSSSLTELEYQESAAFLIAESMGYLYSASLRAIAQLNIANHLAHGPLSLEELAARTQTNADALGRVLRLLATKGVFEEDVHGRFHLTRRACALRAEAYASARNGVITSTMNSHWRSAFELADTIRDGKPGFEKIFGAPFFDYCAEHEEMRNEFHSGMGSISNVASRLAVEAYDFPDDGVIVDVGGGTGGLLLEVLSRKPGLHGVLFDQEYAIANHRLSEMNADGRWDVVTGDFFEEVPRGGCLYTLQHIIHDWDDESCVRILGNCRKAMLPNGRIAIFESIVPNGNTPHASKTLDLVMLIVLTGKERRQAQFESLFARSGLELTKVIPTSGPLSVIEARAV